MSSMLPIPQTNPTHLFDTCVFIDHLSGKNTVATSLIVKAISGEYAGAFSILTDAELWAGIRNPREDKTHRLLLKKLRRLPIIVPIARRAGGLRRIYGIKLADAIIAATAEYHNLIVCTGNVKHFQIISTIQVVGY